MVPGVSLGQQDAYDGRTLDQDIWALWLEASITIQQHCHNDLVLVGQPCPGRVRDALPEPERLRARETIKRWSSYQPTELHSLEDWAEELGLAALYYKDESSRFELSSFKALGGAYAVQLIVRDVISQALDREVTLEEVDGVCDPDLAREITVVTATDGNHGRSVAWGARRFGCQCVIYMHERVSPGRQEAVEALGARVCRVQGNFDDSVRQADADARTHGWLMVSDTSWPGYVDIPRNVMAGYTVMTSEAMDQWPLSAPPTHVFIQGGCGGLAGAVCADLWYRYGADKPHVVVVEPEPAACLYESACASEPRAVNITTESLMAGLSCGEVSLIAWPVLQAAADDFLTITDDPVGPLMGRLAREASITAGESAVAGLAGLMEAHRDEVLWKTLGLSGSSRVLVFGTEGATDPTVYRQLVR
ncbi:MAG: diaminopropionate ammonia-lyase [Planctomycetota bacterium]|nr:diaminopropionate ammonia-lyase [Planctomycetota bacterium]